MKLPRVVLKAYVCEGGVTQYVTDEGSRELDHVFMHRPSDCRFAVVEAPTGFWCVDLYECYLDESHVHISHCDYVEFETLDAALMAARLTH